VELGSRTSVFGKASLTSFSMLRKAVWALSTLVPKVTSKMAGPFSSFVEWPEAWPGSALSVAKIRVQSTNVTNFIFSDRRNIERSPSMGLCQRSWRSSPWPLPLFDGKRDYTFS
jgi:hypothetical protein